jgi:hypothetical protein
MALSERTRRSFTIETDLLTAVAGGGQWKFFLLIVTSEEHLKLAGGSLQLTSFLGETGRVGILHEDRPLRL